MEYNYSLIIPHYNVPHLLRRLLRTVPKRDDMQVIVVDDCSSKDILAELEIIKSDNPHIEFYSTETNGGGGKARNIGLSHALGKYVFFADADDFFLPSIYDILSDYKDSEQDIIFLNAASCDTDSYKPSERNLFLNYYHDIYGKAPALAKKKLRYSFGEPWCKIIRKDIIINNDIRFQEIKCHNDTYFSYSVGHYANSISLDSRITYMITYRRDSIINTNFADRFDIMMKVFLDKEKFFIKNNIPEHAFDIYDYIITNIFHRKLTNARNAYSKMCQALPKKHVRKTLMKRLISRIRFLLGGKKNIEVLNY